MDNSGVIHENIEPPESRYSTLDESRPRIGVPDVEMSDETTITQVGAQIPEQIVDDIPSDD